MLAFKEWLVNVLVNDSQMQTLLSATSSTMPIYPADVDVQPEQFPTITYQDVSNVALTVPQGMHVTTIQLNIWSTNNAIEVENIYDRIQALLNYQDSAINGTSITGTLWWVRESGARDFHTPSRRIWHKQVDLKAWMNKSNNT